MPAARSIAFIGKWFGMSNIEKPPDFLSHQVRRLCMVGFSKQALGGEKLAVVEVKIKYQPGKQGQRNEQYQQAVALSSRIFYV
jgi:hypothetical protein